MSRLSESEAKKKFGQKVREVRKKKGLSQEQVALEIGMDLTSINEIENGHRNPTFLTIYKIAQALGASMSDLVSI